MFGMRGAIETYPENQRKKILSMDVNILIAGLGNILMKDDGIGVYLCRRLQEKRIKNIEIQEIGVEDWRLLSIASGYRDIVIVDAVEMGLLPGECAVWEDVDFTDYPEHSLHNGRFISEFCFIRRLKQSRGSIFLFGIQPEAIGWGIGLGQTLDRNFDLITERLIRFIDVLVKGEIYALH